MNGKNVGFDHFAILLSGFRLYVDDGNNVLAEKDLSSKGEASSSDCLFPDRTHAGWPKVLHLHVFANDDVAAGFGAALERENDDLASFKHGGLTVLVTDVWLDEAVRDDLEGLQLVLFDHTIDPKRPSVCTLNDADLVDASTAGPAPSGTL